MPRSDRQREASRANGQRGKGPATPAGKAKSSQNARSHGLTGKLEANEDEAAYLEQFLLRLSEHFDPKDDYQGKLIQIAMLAELRMLRAYALIWREGSKMLGDEVAERQQERLEAAAVVQEIREWLIEWSGGVRPGAVLPRILAEEMGLIRPSGRQNKTSMYTLMRYAQRFRGQRDRALLKLQAAANGNPTNRWPYPLLT